MSHVECWHVPFKGRLASAEYAQNFLWQFDTTYVMDNHRVASWCWLRHIDTSSPFNLIHIDKHFDTLTSNIDAWLDVMPDVAAISVDDYLATEFSDADTAVTYPLFRWDNYLSLFLGRYATNVQRSIFATHNVGDKPNIEGWMEIDVWSTPGEIRYLKEHDPSPWICNVDLDYFFYAKDQKPHAKLVSEHYINELFSTIGELRDSGEIAVLTLCLSPECCGSWEAAENLAEQVCGILNVPFKLPSDD